MGLRARGPERERGVQAALLQEWPRRLLPRLLVCEAADGGLGQCIGPMAAGPGRAASYVQFTTEKEDKGWTGGPARVWGLKLPLGTPSRASPRPQKSGPTKAP